MNKNHKKSHFQVIHKSKIFVDNKNTDSKKFLQIVERSHHIISLYFTLPKTDKGNRSTDNILSHKTNASITLQKH